MDARIKEYLKKREHYGRGAGRRYPDSLKPEAVAVWELQLKHGVSHTQAARVLGHEVETLQRWRSKLRAGGSSLLAPVVVRQTAAQPSDAATGLPREKPSGAITIQSPDGWSFAVGSAAEAVALVRGLR